MAIDTVSGTNTERIDQLAAGLAELRAETRADSRELRSALRVVTWILGVFAPLIVAFLAFLAHQTYTLMGEMKGVGIELRGINSRLDRIERLLETHDAELREHRKLLIQIEANKANKP